MFKKIAIKSFIIFQIIFISFVLLVGCKKDKNTEEETRTLRVSLSSQVSSINPFFISSEDEDQLCSYFFSPLLLNGEASNTKECLISQIEKQENLDHSLTYTFTMKQGCHFSDGVEITMDDIFFNLYTYLSPYYEGSSNLNKMPILGLTEFQEKLSSEEKEQLEKDFDNLLTFVSTQTSAYLLDTLSSDKLLLESLLYLCQTLENELMDKNQLVSSSLNNEEIFDLLSSNGYGLNKLIATSNKNGMVIINGYAYSLKESETGQYVFAKDSSEETGYKLVDLKEEKEASSYQSNKKYDIDTKDETTFYDLEGNKYQVNETYTIGSVLYQTLIHEYKDKSINLEEFITNHKESTFTVDHYITTLKEKYVSLKNQNTVKNVTGIKQIDESHFSITLLNENNQFLEACSFYVAPYHYYTAGLSNSGIKSNNYQVPSDSKENFDLFLAHLHTFDHKPVGSGAYKMIMDGEFIVDNTFYTERNDYYCALGSSLNNSKIKFVNFVCLAEEEVLDAINNDQIDLGFSTLSIANTFTINLLKSTQIGYAVQSSKKTGIVLLNAARRMNCYERKALLSLLNPEAVNDYYPSLYVKPSYSIEEDAVTTALTYYILAGYKVEKNKVKGVSDYVFVAPSTSSPIYYVFSSLKESLSTLGIKSTIVTSIDSEQYDLLGLEMDEYQEINCFSRENTTHLDYLMKYNTHLLQEEVMIEETKMTYEYELASLLKEMIDEENKTVDDSKSASLSEKITLILNHLSIEQVVYEKNNMIVYQSSKLELTVSEDSYFDLTKVGYID